MVSVRLWIDVLNNPSKLRHLEVQDAMKPYISVLGSPQSIHYDPHACILDWIFPNVNF